MSFSRVRKEVWKGNDWGENPSEDYHLKNEKEKMSILSYIKAIYRPPSSSSDLEILQGRNHILLISGYLYYSWKCMIPSKFACIHTHTNVCWIEISFIPEHLGIIYTSQEIWLDYCP